MIRNDSEYQEAIARLAAERKRLNDQKKRLQEMNLTPQEIKRALDPMRSFHLQLEEGVGGYERLKRGDLGEFQNLRDIGRVLIAARIARGLGQRELAERLGVHESQVSRDERNEYHNITLERAAKILEALKVNLHGTVEVDELEDAAA